MSELPIAVGTELYEEIAPERVIIAEDEGGMTVEVLSPGESGSTRAWMIADVILVEVIARPPILVLTAGLGGQFYSKHVFREWHSIAVQTGIRSPEPSLREAAPT